MECYISFIVMECYISFMVLRTGHSNGSVGVILADSVTDLQFPTARDCLVACGSHGGEFSGSLADHVGIAGIVFNDAGVGRDAAGIAGLSFLAKRGRPAAAVSNARARIGCAAETLAATVVHVNEVAARLGCTPGDDVADALALMGANRARHVKDASSKLEEYRAMVRNDVVRVWVMDSASLVRPSDAGAIIVTGSHGGLVGCRPDRALKVDALGAVFNDAGGGPNGAGWSRLPVLDGRRIPAVTVAAESARIGDGLSSLEDGFISHSNATADHLGIRIGMSTEEFIECIVKELTG